MLPTPTANEDSYRLQGNSQQSNCLAAMAIRGEIAMLPTPAVNDMGDGKTLEWWEEWAPRQQSSDGRPAPHGKSLAIEALRMLPTPTAQAAKHGETPDTTAASFGHNLWDLPTLLIGESTAQPLPDGQTSSEDQRQHPQSQDLKDDPDCLQFLWNG
jgi:hypothetical protein